MPNTQPEEGITNKNSILKNAGEVVYNVPQQAKIEVLKVASKEEKSSYTIIYFTVSKEGLFNNYSKHLDEYIDVIEKARASNNGKSDKIILVSDISTISLIDLGKSIASSNMGVSVGFLLMVNRRFRVALKNNIIIAPENFNSIINIATGIARFEFKSVANHDQADIYVQELISENEKALSNTEM